MHFMAGNVSCHALTKLMTDYLDGALSLTDTMRFHLHLGFCVGCRVYLRQLKHTMVMLGRMPMEPMPNHVREQLMARFQHWKNVRR